MADLCCSELAWSNKLLLRWFSEPVIHASEKFFIPQILLLYSQQTEHHKFITSPLCWSQFSHVSVWCSESYLAFHLLKVTTDICLLDFLQELQLLVLGSSWELLLVLSNDQSTALFLPAIETVLLIMRAVTCQFWSVNVCWLTVIFVTVLSILLPCYVMFLWRFQGGSSCLVVLWM